MAEGWIYLSRQILNHWLWEDEPFDKARAWIDLLFLANYEDVKTSYKGDVITCKRGDVNFSIAYLAERWSWSRHKVSDFLNLLEQDGMIIQRRTYHRTVISIVNYELYQVSKDSKKDSKRTAKGQQKDTINKINKINKSICIYGAHENVKLSDEEYQKLKEKFPDDYQQRIEDLSFYMYNKKKTYTDHYLTILNWARRDGKRVSIPKNNSFNKIEAHDYDFNALEKMLEGK